MLLTCNGFVPGPSFSAKCPTHQSEHEDEKALPQSFFPSTSPAPELDSTFWVQVSTLSIGTILSHSYLHSISPRLWFCWYCEIVLNCKHNIEQPARASFHLCFCDARFWLLFKRENFKFLPNLFDTKATLPGRNAKRKAACDARKKSILVALSVCLEPHFDLRHNIYNTQ